MVFLDKTLGLGKYWIISLEHVDLTNVLSLTVVTSFKFQYRYLYLTSPVLFSILCMYMFFKTTYHVIRFWKSFLNLDTYY